MVAALSWHLEVLVPAVAPGFSAELLGCTAEKAVRTGSASPRGPVAVITRNTCFPSALRPGMGAGVAPSGVPPQQYGSV